MSSLAISAQPLLSKSSSFSDSIQHLRLALVGCGSWGHSFVKVISAIPGLDSIDLCEIHPGRLADSVTYLSAQVQTQVRAHRGIGSMLKSRSPHVTLIATPDYLRAEHAVLALHHGSHVFTGESAGLSPSENIRVLEASRLARREVQLSLPFRLDAPNDSALTFLKGGRAGKISEVRAYSCSGGTLPVPSHRQETVPPESHDKWSGGIPFLSQDTELMDGGWRDSEVHSLGVAGRHGIPLLDFVMQWADDVPDFIHAVGGTTRGLTPAWAGSTRPVLPDHMMAHFRFKVCPVTWEHRHVPGSGSWSRSSGIYFHGSRGLFHLSGDGSWTFTPAGESSVSIHQEAPDSMGGTAGDGVLHRFIQRLRAGSNAYPDLETGSRSALLSMLALRSLAKGVPVQWDS